MQCGTVSFEIWDTSGQERYRSLAPMYYRGSQAALIVYDFTSLESFQKARYWVDELNKYMQDEIAIVLVANKADMHANRAVSIEEATNYAQENGISLMEASAKTNKNVEEIFQLIAKQILGHNSGSGQNEGGKENSNRRSIRLEEEFKEKGSCSWMKC